MHIDISRSRFDPRKAYSGVLALQGRVTLDADHNEVQAIWQHQVRTALADVIGPAGAPRDHAGFAVGRSTHRHDRLADLTISAGRMYVDGILVESLAETTYWDQPFGHLDPDVDQLPSESGYLLYLRVWEREVTVAQDPDLREVALGVHGPDTTARSQVVWQVAAVPLGQDVQDAEDAWQQTLTRLRGPRGLARARARTPEDAQQDVCSLSAEAMFRGHENQLYRVEVFRSGGAGNTREQPRRRRADSADERPPAQLVWSRDNGSDTYPVSRLAGAQVTVADLGRDRRGALDVGDLVEVVDDGLHDRLGRDPGTSDDRFLYTVTAVDTLRRTVRLDRDPTGEIGAVGRDPDLHPLLRRWDGGPIEVEEERWIPLEDGVEIQLARAGKNQGDYRTGDYWLVPARRVTGDVVWPRDDDGPAYLPPHGVGYHYAPLAVALSADGDLVDMRKVFTPLVG